jgi:hypothetical protein
MKRTLLLAILLPLAAQCAGDVPPDVSRWRLPSHDEAFFQGRVVCGAEALTYWIQSAACRSQVGGNVDRYSQFERLLGGDAQQVAKVNKEIMAECKRARADVTVWRKKNPHSRTPSFWMLLALRAPDKLTPETHRVIRETLLALDLGGKESGHIGWMGVNGANGANVHGYLTPLVLAPALIDDQKVRAAGEQALRAELAHMNRTGDMGEFNLLESHWNGTASWEMLKRYSPDPELRRMARMIQERLWINRFLTWSPAVERITGPGSRMAPSEWLGCDNERALLATGLAHPIWLNFFFPWPGWDSRTFRSNWPLTQTEAAVPTLPAYLQDLAWHKELPNELQCRVAIKHWKPYPPLKDVPLSDPLRPAKYVNYQGRGYTLGSVSSSWVVNTCVVVASAWWNNSRNPGAPLGSPERFCVLYPHYVFNGMGTLDKGELFFENAPDKPMKDDKGGPGGPWLREFVDFGRVGTLQDRNTLLLSYTPKPGTHHEGQTLVKSKTQRASAAMFLFRWTEGTDGLYINREPVRSLPRELAPGDWWFIEDGNVFAAVRPLEATRLRGGKTVLEKRTRHIVLYQDNVAAADIAGIADADWVKARSGFVVEMGDKEEFGSFVNFQDQILAGKVASDEADGFTRHITYERGDRSLDLRWHCYTENYLQRKIGGGDDPWTAYAQSPEFAVGDSGRLAVKDATLTTTAGKAAWLLACAPSRTWVAYQPNAGEKLPFTLDCPAGKLTCERCPFGKLVLAQAADGSVQLDVDAVPAQLKLETNITTVKARINGLDAEVGRDTQGGWTICAKKGTP